MSALEGALCTCFSAKRKRRLCREKETVSCLFLFLFLFLCKVSSCLESLEKIIFLVFNSFLRELLFSAKYHSGSRPRLILRALHVAGCSYGVWICVSKLAILNACSSVIGYHWSQNVSNGSKGYVLQPTWVSMCRNRWVPKIADICAAGTCAHEVESVRWVNPLQHKLLKAARKDSSCCIVYIRLWTRTLSHASRILPPKHLGPKEYHILQFCCEHQRWLCSSLFDGRCQLTIPINAAQASFLPDRDGENYIKLLEKEGLITGQRKGVGLLHLRTFR